MEQNHNGINIPPGLAEVLARLRGEPAPTPSSNSDQEDQSQTNHFFSSYAPNNTVDASSHYPATGHTALHDAHSVNGGFPPQSTYDLNNLSTSYNAQGALYGHQDNFAQYNAQERQVIIDPASITDWASGLRCVSKLAAQNATFAEGIKHMIQEQTKHEKQWYSERLAVKMQAANRRKTDAGLKDGYSNHPSVDTTLPNSRENGDLLYDIENSLNPDDQLQLELTAFDRKVLSAQNAMQQHMTGKLKRMGVPFFGTKAELIVREAGATSSDRPKWSPLITDTQLRALQVRMIQHLEDMYKD